MMGVDAEFEIARELIETEVPLFLLGSVTTDAVLLDEGFVRLRCQTVPVRLRLRVKSAKARERYPWEGMVRYGKGDKAFGANAVGTYGTDGSRVKFPALSYGARRQTTLPASLAINQRTKNQEPRTTNSFKLISP